eukprot:GHVO01060476.1.p3 GENE.GHVO01060476.1~~GHVO01060476.1.p3  ORF type:complete len:125 (-),score=23.57 GHVO01060476.1:332-706(-)
MKVICARHLIEAVTNCRMDDGDTEDAEEGANPEGDQADAYVWAYDVHNPVGRKGCDAENNQERNDVCTLCMNLVGPSVKTGLEFGKGKKCGTESCRDEITESSTRCDACASERECTCDTPDSST